MKDHLQSIGVLLARTQKEEPAAPMDPSTHSSSS